MIVYTALDREFSQPIFAEFTEKTGIAVRAKYDAESTKTVGLTEAILNERARPRCDLFWNNEIINTIRLERAGLLRPYKSPAAAAYPASSRSPDGLWYGFAARARVLVINTNQLPEGRQPKSIRDLTDPQWYDRCGIAKPLFGTTATQAACLFAAWGDDKAKDFYRGVKRNARILSGNKQVAESVGGNSQAFGLTDTDDALAKSKKACPSPSCTLTNARAKSGRYSFPTRSHSSRIRSTQKKRKSCSTFSCLADVERKLAKGPSAQIPLQPGVEASPRVKTPAQVRAMEVDWSAAAAKWHTAAQFLQTEFTAAD